jgi:hypothetical protein
MRRMLNSLGQVLLVVGTFAPLAMGQDRDRASVAGEVVSKHGKPVPHAQVTLVHRPIGWCAEYGDIDVVRVATDSKGRFRAEVLPARPYSAFATWQEAGKPAATTAVEHVAAGAFVSLRAWDAAVVPVAVGVEGQQAWVDAGPLGFRVVPRIAHLWPIPVTPSRDGTVALPTLPGESALFEVTTREGHTLFSTWVKHDQAQQVVRLPPPVAVPLQVVDAASGKPVPDAGIKLRSSWLGYRVAFPQLDAVQYSRDYWRPVGKTDADGRATVVVPADAGPWPLPKGVHLALAVQAESYAMAFGGWTSEGAFWDGKAQAENPNPLQISLQPQRPVIGRLTLDGTAPAAGLPVILWTDVTVSNKNGGGGSSWDAPVQFATTDAQGAFRFPYAPRGPVPLRIGVALDNGDVRRRLTVDGLAPVLLAAPFSEAGMRGAFGRDENLRELGTGSLGAETALAVRLVDPTGSPIRGVEVFLLPGTASPRGIATHNTTDGAGRCLLFPASAGQLLVATAPGRGYVIAPVAGDRAQEVQLVPFSFAAGKVLQADGTPAAGATLWGSGMRATFDPKMAERDQVIRSIAGQLNDHVAAATCDGAGLFRLPYVPMQAAALRAHVTLGDGPARQTATVMIEIAPRTEPAPVEVRLVR